MKDTYLYRLETEPELVELSHKYWSYAYKNELLSMFDFITDAKYNQQKKALTIVCKDGTKFISVERQYEKMTTYDYLFYEITENEMIDWFFVFQNVRVEFWYLDEDITGSPLYADSIKLKSSDTGYNLSLYLRNVLGKPITKEMNVRKIYHDELHVMCVMAVDLDGFYLVFYGEEE